MTYGRSRSVVPGATEAVLTGSDGQLFLSVRDDATGLLIGIARMAIHPGWAGIFGLWVDPAHRRRGIASTIVSAIAMVARENAMPAIYLQVSADNADGVAFWRESGQPNSEQARSDTGTGCHVRGSTRRKPSRGVVRAATRLERACTSSLTTRTWVAWARRASFLTARAASSRTTCVTSSSSTTDGG